MTENNSNNTFTGQQENEKILTIITPHQFAFTLEYVKLFGISIFLLVGFGLMQKVSPLFTYTGTIFTVLATIVGLFFYRSIHSKRVTYITNRRIVRFEPSNAFIVNTRSLTWDNILKVKTFAPNFLWRVKNTGTVVIHSKTTSTSVNSADQVLLNNDDIVLKDVYFFKDLGNYIDKILYLYGHSPEELDTIRPFIAKAKGQRY